MLSALVCLLLLTPSVTAAPVSTSACRTAGHSIYQREGVSCKKAKRVLHRYLSGSSTHGWSCSRYRRRCDGSGISIDSYRSFRWT